MDLRSNCVQNAPPGGRPRSTNVENLGRSGRIRTCDPCAPTVSSNRKDQQKQQTLLVVDHLYPRLFTGSRWSAGGRPHRRNLWLFDENEKPRRVTDFYSVGCRFESCWDRQ